MTKINVLYHYCPIKIKKESHNEFGEIAASFNTMAKKLEEYSSSDLERLMMVKKRIETLINNMSEALIGLDETGKILFMNDTALTISNLKKEVVIGNQIQEVAKSNDLIRTLASELILNAKPEPIKLYADQKESYFEKEFIPIKIIPTSEKEEKKYRKCNPA